MHGIVYDKHVIPIVKNEYTKYRHTFYILNIDIQRFYSFSHN